MSKTILLTGASSGIGQAAALAFAALGNRLILVSMKNKEGLKKTAYEAAEKVPKFFRSQQMYRTMARAKQSYLRQWIVSAQSTFW